jgi:hypothetical protein
MGLRKEFQVSDEVIWFKLKASRAWEGVLGR